LPPLTLQALQEHLRTCEDCCAYLNTYRATIHATRTVRYDAMPAVLQDRLLRFLRTQVNRGAAVLPLSAPHPVGNPLRRHTWANHQYQWQTITDLRREENQYWQENVKEPEE
jgi:hypothetical protein